MRFRLYRAGADGRDVVGMTEGEVEFHGGKSFVLVLEMDPDNDPHKTTHPNIIIELIREDASVLKLHKEDVDG